MRLIKKSNKNKDVIERFKKDSFGISRVGRGWNVKLGRVNGKVLFQKYIADSKWENHLQGLRFALFVRDEKRKDLQKIGLCNGSPVTKKQAIIDKNGKLRRLYLCKIQDYYRWEVHYGKKRDRFPFHKTGRVKQAFLAAVMQLRKFEIEEIGHSEIEISPISIDMYLNAFIKSMNKDSDKFRYLRRFL